MRAARPSGRIRPIARIAPTVLALGLLGGSAAAFAVTERLKLEPTPITDTRVPYRIFSPVCGCDRAEAPIGFRLRKRSRLRVELLDEDDRVVRTLVDGERVPAGDVELAWDGRDGDGALVPDGVYRPRVRLRDRGWTIVLPTPIRIDTVRPGIELGRVAPLELSPDSDGRREYAQVFYEVSEPAKAAMYVDGVQIQRSRFQPREGKLNWFARVRGRGLPAGVYGLQLAAVDTAGNLSERTPAVRVRIRYTRLARERVVVRTRTRFGVRVLSHARSYRWRFARATGTARPGLLILRAPRRPGRYRLYVSANGRGDQAVVVVRKRKQRR